MAITTDILLDENEDLLIENGDFVIGDSNEQHIRHILRLAPGQNRMAPLLGANIIENLKGNLDGDFKRKIRIMLAMDGVTVNDVQINNGELNIDAIRK